MITGMPGIGKTTLIRKLADEIAAGAVGQFIPGGFYTDEICEDQKRVGFGITTFSGTTGILAHKKFKSNYRVAKYGVDLNTFERIGLRELRQCVAENKLILIDEIGKMELFSKDFQDLVWQIFTGDQKAVATILWTPHPFCSRLKERPGVKLFVLTKDNRNQLIEDILETLRVH